MGTRVENKIINQEVKEETPTAKASRDSSKTSLFALLYPLKLLLCIIVAILIFGIGLVSLVVWLPLRVLVQGIAKVVRRDLDGMLRPRRVALAQEGIYNKPEFNILVFNEYEGTVSKTLFCDLFRERILGPNMDRVPFQYKRLTTCVTSFCGYFFWKHDKNFCIENHIRTYEEVLEDDQGIGSDQLPEKKYYDEDDLKDIASRLNTRKWRPGQSPWEIIILNSYRSTNSSSIKVLEDEGPKGSDTVIVYRFHHALADGYSLLNFIAQMNNYSDEISAKPRFRKRNLCFELCSALVMPLKAFWDTVLWLANRQWDWNNWVQKSTASPLWSQYISTWNCEIPLDRIKNLKNRYNVSFFAVQQALIGGVLAKFMRASGSKVPGKLTCLIPMPLPNHPLGMSVYLTPALVDIFTGEGDVTKRLEKSQETFLRDRSSLGQTVVTNLFLSLCLAPNFIVKMLYLPGVTFGFTPFPGFANHTELTPEHSCKNVFFTIGLAPSCSAVCNMTSLSCFGKMNFTFTCRRHVIDSRPTIDQFSHFLEEEIVALEKASANLKV